MLSLRLTPPPCSHSPPPPQDALYIALESGLRLLHPFMPFVTEELWQRLPRRPGQCDDVKTIMLAPWPKVEPSWADAQADADVEQAQAVVRAMRSLRSAYGLVRSPSAAPVAGIMLSLAPPPTRGLALSCGVPPTAPFGRRRASERALRRYFPALQTTC